MGKGAEIGIEGEHNKKEIPLKLEQGFAEQQEKDKTTKRIGGV